MKRRQEWSPRKFISTVTGAGAVLMLNPTLSSSAGEQNPRIAGIVKKTIGVDTHNHIDVPINAAELPGPTVDLAGELGKSGLAVRSTRTPRLLHSLITSAL